VAKEMQILSQGRICQSWECYKKLRQQARSQEKQGKILVIKVLGSYVGVVSCEFKFC